MADLQNKANLMTAAQLGITDINAVPRMDKINSVALMNASPRGALLATKVNMSNVDAAIASCQGLSYAQVKQKNIAARVSSTDTSCGWIQFSQTGQGVSILGTSQQPIGPMPTQVTQGSKYFSPQLTTSSRSMNDNWAEAILCIPSSSGYSCTAEGFQDSNQMERGEKQIAYATQSGYAKQSAYATQSGYAKQTAPQYPKTSQLSRTLANARRKKSHFTDFSSSFSSVDTEFSTPFLDQIPAPRTAALTRDSYLQTDTNIGTMAATLYQESQKGMSDPTLETRSSYSIFTKAMTSGAPDMESWETSFKANPVPTDLYPRPSRDVPVIYGNLEEHDFCAELNEQTIINENNLPCLQKEWLRKGGSVYEAGYPDTRLYGSCYGRIRKN